MIPLDKELQWVNVKQKPFRQIQAHSGTIKRIQTLCKPGILRAVVYPEPCHIQNQKRIHIKNAKLIQTSTMSNIYDEMFCENS